MRGELCYKKLGKRNINCVYIHTYLSREKKQRQRKRVNAVSKQLTFRIVITTASKGGTN